MKSLRKPKDGKTFVANGHRFSTLQDVKVYAYVNDMFICHTSKDRIFTYVDLAIIPRQDQMD